tara:strand:- start:384 stop:692 length:309 start_codon:yes stop_codon:yes gene_type:complete
VGVSISTSISISAHLDLLQNNSPKLSEHAPQAPPTKTRRVDKAQYLPYRPIEAEQKINPKRQLFNLKILHPSEIDRVLVVASLPGQPVKLPRELQRAQPKVV